jgi:hypothetical protein
MRLSLFGGAVFAVSIVALFLMPDAIPVVGMLVGGMCVWIGFIWTLMAYYFHPPPPPPEG